jgi:hypothetical protein
MSKAVCEAKARDFAARVEAALYTVHELEENRRSSQKPPRASPTNPEARVMKMGDGGFRPGMNVQLATAGGPMSGPRTIVAVAVSHAGSDMGTLQPLVERIARRTGELPELVLADAHHANHGAIESLEKKGVEVRVPVDDRTSDKHASAELEAWKQHMQTNEAQERYRARTSLCEPTNANARRMAPDAALGARHRQSDERRAPDRDHARRAHARLDPPRLSSHRRNEGPAREHDDAAPRARARSAGSRARGHRSRSLAGMRVCVSPHETASAREGF